VKGTPWRVADTITRLRFLMLPIVWWYAMLGDGRLVAAGLIAAGLTDFLDGYVARRLGQASPAGARLDLSADTLLLLSALAWIEMLHPEIFRENAALIAGALMIYLASVAAGLLKFRSLPNLHLYSSRVAGGFLYAFATITLATGRYHRLLLALAAVAFIVSCAETLAGELIFSAVNERVGSVLLVRSRRADTNTAQANGSDKTHRSQAPTAKAVGSKASPMRSTATAAAPRPNDSGPYPRHPSRRRIAGAKASGAAIRATIAIAVDARCKVDACSEAGPSGTIAASTSADPATPSRTRPINARGPNATASPSRARPTPTIAAPMATAAGSPGSARRLIVRRAGS
jgi:phosphatidylglycerophosphate synthase